ncbi:MAG: hypothetical protein J6K81_01710 [Rikenellaceae bacterium]|nr:hypothetical protein [Rikenellaceae bacterium]
MKTRNRTFVAVLLFAFVMSTDAAAQRRFENPAYLDQCETPHTVSVTFNTPYLRAIMPMGLEGLIDMLTLGGSFLGPIASEGHDTKCSPGISVDWRKMLNPVVSLGASVGYSHMSTWYDSDYSTGLYCQRTRTNLIATTFQLELTYLRRGIFTMYGLWEWGFGMRFQHQHNTQINTPHTRWQVDQPDRPQTDIHSFRFMMMSHRSPLGFRFGRRLGRYFELGFGYRGILSAGIDYQF